MKRKPLILIALVAAALSVGIALVVADMVTVSGATPAHRATMSHKPHYKTVTVKIVTNHSTIGRYSPSKVTVHVGQKIVFKNISDTHHTVTSSDFKSFVSPDIPRGHSWSYKPKKTGRFKYVCIYHPLMKGEIIVKR